MRGVAAAIVVVSLAFASATVSVIAQATVGGNPKAAAVKNPVASLPIRSTRAGKHS